MEHFSDEVHDEYLHKYTYEQESSCDFWEEIEATDNTVDVTNDSPDDQELLRSFS